MNEVRKVFKFTAYSKTNFHLKLETVTVTPTWGRFKYGQFYNWYSKYTR